jgi:pyruvate ferredoxin oxidoreductase alpha subunit
MAEIMELHDVEVWDGNMAAAQAFRQAQIDVMAAYPITPSTPTVQNYSQFLADGYVDGEFIMVESEHAAMSGCVGASAAGGRVATATSSQGLALMIEVLYQAAGMRLPIVLQMVNRALAAPLNVNGDHSDMYLARDSGWIQLDSFNPQEAYDLTLMAFKIGEDLDVRLPVVMNQDGFICSHTAQNVRPLTDEAAFKFVGEFKEVDSMLDFSKPVTYGAQTEEDWHFEHKAKQHKAIMDSPKVIQKVFDEFAELTGRRYNILEKFFLEDADVAIVAMGTTVESAVAVAQKLRNEGVKAGVLGLRVLRPFPFDEIAEALGNVKAIATLDRSSPAGAMGMLYNEICGAVYGRGVNPLISNYIYGLGGRDMTMEHLENIFSELQENVKAGKLTTPKQQFSGLRGPKLSFF